MWLNRLLFEHIGILIFFKYFMGENTELPAHNIIVRKQSISCLSEEGKLLIRLKECKTNNGRILVKLNSQYVNCAKSGAKEN